MSNKFSNLKKFHVVREIIQMVGDIGLEPMTPCL